MGQKQSQGQDANAAAGAPGSGFGQGSGMSTTARVPTNKVQLAVSVLGGVPGATAYHSSITVNGEEFFFSDGGIAAAGTGLPSHKQAQNPPEVIDMGMSHYSGSQLKAALDRHFLPGTYDLLRKNCNSFSDCALFYLLQKRLDKKYRSLERLGAANMGLVSAVSGGNYTPNPKVDNFDLEKLVVELDPEKVWTTPGQATGGTTVTSAEAMRAARLARLTGGSSASGTAAGDSGSAAAPGTTSSATPAA